MSRGYESFFGLVERPFSLTPDPKYFFKSRRIGALVETLTCGLRRRERFLLVTGDLGVGKTTLCRTLDPELRGSVRSRFVANPLLTPSGLFRLLLEDFGAASAIELTRRHRRVAPTSFAICLVEFLNQRSERSRGAVVVIDEAHTMPVQRRRASRRCWRALDAAARTAAAAGARWATRALVSPLPIGIRALDEHVVDQGSAAARSAATNVRAYVAHRLAVAGGDATRHLHDARHRRALRPFEAACRGS